MNAIAPGARRNWLATARTCPRCTWLKGRPAMPMDSSEFVGDQYHAPSKLDARGALHDRFGANPTRWPVWIFDRLGVAPGCQILDVGCGNARLWQANVSRLPARCRVALADLSEGMIQAARCALPGGAPVDFHVADVQRLPFAKAHFDRVVAIHMLFHVPDIDQALRQVTRILKPGGRFFASTMGQANMADLFEWIDRCEPSARPWANPDHNRFTLEKAPPILERHLANVHLHVYDDDLKVTEVEPLIAYVDSMSTPPLLSPDGRDRLRRMLTDELAKRGQIFIRKSTGLFEAWGAK